MPDDDEVDPPDNVRSLRPLTGRVGEIMLPAELRQGTIVRRSFGLRGWCQHRETVVDTEARVVVCRACETELDPFDVLGTVAHEWEFLARVIRETKETQEKLDALRDEEKRIKARLRTGKSKMPPSDGELVALRSLELACRGSSRAVSARTVYAALSKLDRLRSATGEGPRPTPGVYGRGEHE